MKFIAAVIFSIAPLLLVEAADSFPFINQACLVESEVYGGLRSDNPVSDRTLLPTKIRTDSRPSAFQICTSEPELKGIVNGFRLITS